MKRRIIEECLDIARRNNTPEKHPEWKHYHHYSFVVQHGKILDWGVNRKSHPISILGYGEHTKMHSETDAYFNAKGILDYSTYFEVVNIRLTNTGKIASSQPCPCCYALLKRVNCKRVWYSTNMGLFACITF
jgi:tRNA(Arg) A34 adenosine deaminase TadA